MSFAAVHELNKPNAYSLGTQLRVSDKHRYSDLDELIDAHVKQMARRVNEMTNSERFKGTKEQLGARSPLCCPFSTFRLTTTWA